MFEGVMLGSAGCRGRRQAAGLVEVEVRRRRRLD